MQELASIRGLNPDSAYLGLAAASVTGETGDVGFPIRLRFGVGFRIQLLIDRILLYLACIRRMMVSLYVFLRVGKPVPVACALSYVIAPSR